MEIFLQVVVMTFCVVQFSPNGHIKEVSGASPAYSWTEGTDWSPCSTTCDDGYETLRMQCIKRDSYNLINYATPEECQRVGIPLPLEANVKKCNLGNCGAYYLWRVTGEWSECSQTCGPNGMQTREVQCQYLPKQGKSRSVSFSYCTQGIRPIMRQRCNRIDCPPTFQPLKWGPCLKPRIDCEVSKRLRSLTCGSQSFNGSFLTLPLAACSSRKSKDLSKIRPPSTWESCYEHANKDDCVKRKPKTPEIMEKVLTLIQMRKGDRIALQVGQEAYLLPWTKIVVSCPVNFFIQSNLRWDHISLSSRYNNTLGYNGKSKDRVSVDRMGRLRIRRFLPVDEGEWKCIAGVSNAAVTLKLRDPADGYADWTYRNSLWSDEMMNEDSKDGLQRREIMQWVSQPWSACSATCGKEAFQSRVVNCEKLENNHFFVMKDEDCIKEGLPKPEGRQTCQENTDCPEWTVKKVDPQEVQCTDKCIDVNIALSNVDVSCTLDDQTVDVSRCNPLTRPDTSCNNPKCQVVWRESSWSQCSLSCSYDGEKGFRARYLTCVWKHSGKSAGGACYRQQMPIPAVTEECEPPNCDLKCVDLSADCQAKSGLCGHTLYRSACCATCTQIISLPTV